MIVIKLVLPALVAGGCGLLLTLPIIARAEPRAIPVAQRFIATHEAKVRPLEVATSLAWWNANVTGKDEDFKRKEEAQNRLDEALADRAAFAQLQGLKDANQKGFIEDPLVARQIDLLYL